jgi:uncharacterized integral membrane protein
MQFYLVSALVFALIVAIFSINNPNTVSVNFLVWSFQAPLVLIILSSAVFGAVVIFLLGIVKQIGLIRKVKNLENTNKKVSQELEEIKTIQEDTIKEDENIDLNEQNS